VHLSDFPVAQAEAYDEHLEQQMAAARRFVEQGLAARDAARVRVRQPLRSLAVPGDPLPEELAAIVRDELNVKALLFGAPEVQLDTEVDEELRAEGLAREVVRQVNDLRKKAGLNVEDRIRLRWEAEDGVLAGALERWNDYVAREVLATDVARGRSKGMNDAEVKIEGEPLWIGLKKRS
jgi:isoleucyl-tRNA synthetase